MHDQEIVFYNEKDKRIHDFLKSVSPVKLKEVNLSSLKGIGFPTSKHPDTNSVYSAYTFLTGLNYFENEQKQFLDNEENRGYLFYDSFFYLSRRYFRESTASNLSQIVTLGIINLFSKHIKKEYWNYLGNERVHVGGHINIDLEQRIIPLSKEYYERLKPIMEEWVYLQGVERVLNKSGLKQK